MKMTSKAEYLKKYLPKHESGRVEAKRKKVPKKPSYFADDADLSPPRRRARVEAVESKGGVRMAPGADLQRSLDSAQYEDLEKMQRDKEREDPLLALLKKKSKLQVERTRKGTY